MMKIQIENEEKSNPEEHHVESSQKKQIAEIIGTSHFVIVSFDPKEAELLKNDRNTEATMMISHMSPKHLYYASRSIMAVAQDHSPKGVLDQMLKDLGGHSDVRIGHDG